MKQDLKGILDNLVRKYESPDFIPRDPVKFPHMFDNSKDQEVSALIASCLAYGKREKIIESVQKIHEIMDFKPCEFVLDFNIDKDAKLFNGFLHRYTTGRDVILLIYILNKALKEWGSLKKIFYKGFSSHDENIKPALTFFVDKLREYLPPDEKNLKGIYHLIPDPAKGSACKRLNLFLKWMVRTGPVDLHLWKEIPANKLIIPLDTHVAKLSRKAGLTQRKADDWKTAEEITEKLKQFDSSDPVKYDFALFGMGISKEIVDFK